MCVAEIEEARRWIFKDALPFWLDAGVDRHAGGFHEALDLQGRPVEDTTRRLRVTCRQVYVFSHAAVLGWPDGLQAARDGAAWLTSRAWLGPDGGWARLLSARGEVLDPTPDLYDHAFALFALAWLHRATGDTEALTWAHRTLDFLDRRLRHPDEPGFLHARPAPGWRLQNPHMHLLEAALALYETSRHPRFAALAAELATLFSTRFYARRTGTLAEVYTDELSPVPGAPGRRTEPGHQFEWAWILSRHGALLGVPTARVVQALVTSAEAHGVDPISGLTYNAVLDDGTPVDRGSRTWPNTERIKGHVALFEACGVDPSVPLARATRVLFDRYLAHRPAGTWMDAYDADGRPLATTIPASTLYHVFLALTELVRIAPMLRRVTPADAVEVPLLVGV